MLNNWSVRVQSQEAFQPDYEGISPDRSIPAIEKLPEDVELEETIEAQKRGGADDQLNQVER